MREIKFRAWDKKSKHMFVGVSMLSAWNNEKKCFDMEYQDTICMQFTGLLDKNGKEIYEGDILKWTHPSFAENKVEYKILIVRDIRNSLLIEQDCAHGWIEIIGNVYENKELIK